jgi:hypothetical protein
MVNGLEIYYYPYYNICLTLKIPQIRYLLIYVKINRVAGWYTTEIPRKAGALGASPDEPGSRPYGGPGAAG